MTRKLMRKQDLTGQRFGRLSVIKFNGFENHRAMWLCLCDCGNYKVVQGKLLKSGHTKSCGCYRIDKISKHGKYNTRLYKIYYCMMNRCYYKNDVHYKNYGGRGIAVCNEWKDDFMAFYKWAYENGYAENLTIDRIDNNKGYSPTNCQWVDMKQQARNRRSNRNYTINGETHCLMDWCDILGFNYKTIQSRLYRGWSIEKALEME